MYCFLIWHNTNHSHRVIYSTNLSHHDHNLFLWIMWALSTRCPGQRELLQFGFDIVAYNFVHLIETMLREHWRVLSWKCESKDFVFCKQSIESHACFFTRCSHVIGVSISLTLQLHAQSSHKIVSMNRNHTRRSFQFNSLDVWHCVIYKSNSFN